MTKKTTNVLYFSNQANISGGAERSLFELLKNLDPLIVTPFFASAQYGNLTQSIIKLGMPFYKIEGFEKKNPFPFLSSTLGLVGFINQNKIDVIHNNQCSDTFYTWIPGKLTNTPIIIHHRDSYFSRYDSFFTKIADCNICISNWQNNEFLGGNATLIHNGINLTQFDIIGKSKPKADKITIGLIGNIAPIKGQDVFIRAASIVLKNKDVRFILVGDDKSARNANYVNQLKEMIKILGIEKNIHFLGYANCIENIFHEIDISVIPSVREPFGRVIIESMASEVPVIATNIGGALDIITPNTGILIPVNDPSALAEAIIFLINNPDKRKRYGIEGRKRVENFFSVKNTLKGIYDVYLSVTNTQ